MRPSPTTLPTTFPVLLAGELRADPARPLVTYYDDASGERVELSVTTFANWVAKTASLVQDELDVEPGELVVVDLPTHWLGPVWLGALWSGGQVVSTNRSLAGEAALVVCGPDTLDDHRTRVPGIPVVAVSLRPLGAPFAEPLPSGVVDYGAVVLAQPDSFSPLDPPLPESPAWRDQTGTTTQADLLARATAPTTADGMPLVRAPGGRLLTDVNPCSGPGPATLLSPLAHGGGTIWVRHVDESRWDRRRSDERATAEVRAAGPDLSW